MHPLLSSLLSSFRSSLISELNCLSLIHLFLHIDNRLPMLQDVEGSSQHVKQFQYTGWPSQGVPSSAVGLIDLREQVEKWQRNSGDKPIIIHCRYANTRVYYANISFSTSLVSHYHKPHPLTNKQLPLTITVITFPLSQTSLSHNHKHHPLTITNITLSL